MKDVDMTREMMNESRLSILLNVTQSMIIQANQEQHGVLALLR